MLAAKSVKEIEESSEGFSNVISFEDNNLRLLKSAAIYGANGSGKSNLVSAFSFFRRMIVKSFKDDEILSGVQTKRFLFSANNDEPTAFEMILIIKDKKYRYGFSVLGEAIDSEWLFEQKLDSQKESYCFRRIDNEITCNSKVFKASKEARNNTRKNALFLSTSAIFNVETAITIVSYFESSINIISGIDNNSVSYTARQLMNNEEMHDRIVAFMKNADFGIEDIRAEETLIDKLDDIKDPMLRKLLDDADYENKPVEKKLKELNIKSFHRLIDDSNPNSFISIPFRKESIGTIKTFAMIGPWLDTLMNGKVLIVDEFGASLHTKLALEMLRLFHSKLNNGAQLIVTTHDTNLLRKDLLRRDQIWFVEKNKEGVSDLYSLVEYKINQATSVRNDASFSKDYLAGKYGAIPYFGNINQFIEDYGKE